MYYTKKPNVFPQEKLKIPYNILFMLKASIYTLLKVNIEFFISFNCRKKEYIKIDRDKSTFKSHRDFDSEIEMTFKHF